MKGSKTKALLNACLIIYGIIYQILILNKMLKYAEVISATTIIIIAFISIIIFGYKKDSKNKIKSDITIKTIIFIILYFAFIYLSGFIVTFEKNAYSMKLIKILNNIFIPIIIITCTEIYRYVMISSTNDKKKIKYICISLTIFEILITIKINSLFAIASAFKTITVIIFPIICKNILLTYMSRYGGLKSTLIYRLCLDLYIYLIPILPKYSDYVKSMIGICFPILIYLYISKVVEESKYRHSTSINFKQVSKIKVLSLLLLICFIALISDIFPLTILGVGSNSMVPYVEKGDAVIILKTKDEESIKKGNIIAFRNKKNGKTVIHRVVDIEKEENRKYITKGDANKSNDDIDLYFEDIKGVVKFKIKYIAKPSIYFSELLK